MANPFLLTAAQGAINGLTSTFNNRQQLKNSMKMADYNSKLAMENWRETFAAQNKRQDELNLSSAETARLALQRAGLNPASLTNNPYTTGVSSGNMAMPANGATSSMQAPSLLEAAQIENIKANTKKTESETEGQNYSNKILENDAAFREAYNLGQLDMVYSTIQLNQFKNKLTDAETKVAMKNAEKINAESGLITEQIELVRSQADKARVEAAFAERSVKAEIAHLCALANLSEQEAKLIPQKLQNLILEGQKLTLGNTSLAIENGRLAIQLDMDEEFKYIDKIIDSVGNAIGLVSDGLNIKNIIKGKPGTNVNIHNSRTNNYTGNNIQHNH